MVRLSPSRRPRRSGEWTEANAVTFIVTLVATQSVTLAAAAARMNRKSAYALKVRNAPSPRHGRGAAGAAAGVSPG